MTDGANVAGLVAGLAVLVGAHQGSRRKTPTNGVGMGLASGWHRVGIGLASSG
jgi:hypothetical protein